VDSDPVLVRRARIGRMVAVGKRIGYGALLAAMVGFVAGTVSGFPSWSIAVAVGGLIVAIVVLPVPIVLGYGIRAAEREEQGGRFH
jgi:hypothetical protein